MNISRNYITCTDNFISELSFNDRSWSIKATFTNQAQLMVKNMCPDKTCSQVVNTISKLFCLIYLFNYFGIEQIPNEVFTENITTNTSFLHKYKDLLEKGCMIQSIPHFGLEKEITNKKRNSSYKSRISPYKVLINFSRGIKPIKIQYTFSFKENKSLYTSLKDKAFNKFKGQDNSYSASYTTYKNTSFDLNDCPIAGYDKKCILTSDTSFDLSYLESNTYTKLIIWPWIQMKFLPRYSRLTFKGNEISFSEKVNSALKEGCHFSGKDRRFYSRFHSLKRNYRKYVYFDGQPLVEKFDVHNCHYCLLNPLIKNEASIPQAEKDEFWNLTVEQGKFYEKFIGYLNDGTSREDVKKECTRYLNFRPETLNRLRKNYENPSAPKKEVNKNLLIIKLDIFFETFFPNIRKYIYLIKASDYKVLHYSLNEVETAIMTAIVYRLWYEHHIEAITLHDGIYLKENDGKWIDALGISTEIMFKEYLMKYEISI